MIGPARLAEEEDRILACIHCGFCLPACPTYQVLGSEADSPRGRISLIRALAEGRIAPDDEALYTHLDRCLGCLACETACPSGVEYGVLLERAREVQKAERGLDLPTRILLAGFGRRWLRAPLRGGLSIIRESGLARLLTRLLPRRFPSLRLSTALLAATVRWRGLRGMSDAEEGQQERSLEIGPERGADSGPRVILLEGCVQSVLFYHVRSATERVLRANGFELARKGLVQCCGALHSHAGAPERARELARANIAAFQRSGAELVISDAAGCGLALKNYGELLADDEEWASRARDLSERVRDLGEVLVEVGARPGRPLHLRVGYDAPCHLLHGQGIDNEYQKLLREIAGIEVSTIRDEDVCCGGAGIYNLRELEIGDELREEKVRAVVESGMDAVVTPNPGCMMQIAAGLLLAGSSIPVLHPVEILAESYRGSLSYSRTTT